MYKVMIADDEPKIRRGLAEAVDWAKLDMEICGFAANGQAAAELVNEQKPDICLVDICMPLLNGLELIRTIKSQSSRTICIVITGYDEFSYAQEAVSAGVFEYILKPVNELQLEKTLLRARDLLGQQELTAHRLRQAEEMLILHRDTMIESFLNESIQGQLSVEEQNERAAFLAVSFSAEIAVLQLAIQEESIPAEYSERDRQVLRYAVRNVLQELCERAGTVYMAVSPYGQYRVLIDLQDKELWEKLESTVRGAVALFSDIRLLIDMAVCRNLHEVFEQIRDWELREQEHLGPLTTAARRYLEEQYAQADLTAAEVAQHINVSPSYLSRMFKQEMGVTITDFLTKIRMREAMRLLNTDLMIYEVAERVGYHSQHYFCVAFKRYTGVTPTEYKQQ